MGVNLSRIMQTAVRVAVKVGAASSATITRPVPPPDALTGTQSGSASSQTVPVVSVRARRTEAETGDAWSQHRSTLLVAAADVAFTPLVGDLCTWMGVSQRVSNVETSAPAGVPISFLLTLGGE